VSWHFRVLTPTLAAGGVAVVRVTGDLTGFFDASRLKRIEPGRRGLRLLAELDQGLACRWNEHVIDLMPHGGLAMVREVVRWLERLGGHAGELSLGGRWPEAADTLEARVLEALARTQSPVATELLLRQPGLWQRKQNSDASRDAVLQRLLEPPLVVAVGPSNVGKSSLLNALAGRTVAVTADEPGTTRDHVGVMLNLDGLALRYADTPGIRACPTEEERIAWVEASELIRHADLVLSCGDRTSPGLTAGDLDRLAAGRPVDRILRIGTRCDLGTSAATSDVEVSVHDPASVWRLARRIREELVPASSVHADVPWKFWTDTEE